MKITDLIASDKPTVSFEIFPPKRPEPSLFGEAEIRERVNSLTDVTPALLEAFDKL